MRSKLCPHIQVLDSRTLEAIGRAQPRMVKTMDLSRQVLESIMCYHQAAGMGLRCSVFSGVQYGK